MAKDKDDATFCSKFGLPVCVEGRELVLDQMLHGHRYRNDLTAIEVGRRAVVRDILRDQESEIRRLEADVVEATRIEKEAALTLSSTRSASRKRSETKEMRDRLHDARAKRSAAIRALREERHRR